MTVSDIKVTFSSSLTYADRLMLKKHRKNPEGTVSYSRPSNQGRANFRAVSNKPVSNPGSVSPPRLAHRLPKFAAHNGKGQASVSNQQKALTNNEANYPSVLQIQLLPSDEDESRYGSSDPDSSSPIINYAVDESSTMRTDRRTLSQMGKLAIVELSFSDPENDIKTKESNCSCLTSHSSLSLQRASSGLKNPPSDSINQGNGHLPHPPTIPSNTYVARQKILMEKNKKGANGQDAVVKVKKVSKTSDRVWRPESKYVGLNSFFMAGVEKENIDNTSLKSEDTSPKIDGANSNPMITVGLGDSWRPDSSLSQVEVTSTSKGTPRRKDEMKSKNEKPKNSSKLATRSKEGASTLRNKCVSKNQTMGSQKSVTPGQRGNSLAASSMETPRSSMNDFDFLSALPPASKGDDLLKLHRASTVTLFALSPQPPDVWNDDSEIEVPNVIKSMLKTDPAESSERSAVTRRPPSSDAERKECDNDDALTLDALSKEIMVAHTAANKQDDANFHWEDDSLSIEDNDDGSGLTSSADGDESDEDGHDY